MSNRLKIDVRDRNIMDAWDFFIPSIGIFLGVNILTCCLGIRRIRLLEQRVHILEERPAPDATNITVPYTTVPNYIQPQPTYTYYQQPSAPPNATVYYPQAQDPQSIQRY
jgi:hypothetical protein